MTGLAVGQSQRRFLALLIAATTFVCMPIACRKAKNTGKKIGTTDGKAAADDSHCASLADSALDMLEPDRLGISARVETAVSVLNQWGARCGDLSAETIHLNAKIKPIVVAALGDDTPAQLSDPHFTRRDGLHIRDCLLFRRQTGFLARPGHDLDRVVHLFNYVIRNVALIDESVPLSPFQIFLFGRGTPRERAWVFAELLRQLKIDAVILRPASETLRSKPASNRAATDKPDPRWLIGVLLDGNVYLFDPRLGTPIPSAAEKADGIRSLQVRRPATLAEVRADGTLLSSLGTGEKFPYPLTAEDLRSPRVEWIADTGFWSPRMKQLQASLSGERTVIVYDALAQDEDERGALARIREFDGRKWDAKNVGLWTFPEQTLRRVNHPDDQQTRRLRILEAPFAVPFQQVRTRQGRVGLQPEHLQRKTRISQLLGRYRDAAKSYLFVRMHADIPVQSSVPPEIRRYHVRAAEDATYWGGLCQMEQDDYPAAINTLIAYVKRYGKRAVWLSPTRGLLAECFARQKDYDHAIRSIENLSDDDPYKPAYQYRVRRLASLKATAEKSHK